ncbi:uncharacterized protein [Littorina saxatilis]|uniref:uncharacterized protein n=1 Tax=Littorina saxatilis TaxID=31220 RepID=UPI0038B5FE82
MKPRTNAVSTSEHSVPLEERTSSNDVQPALDIDFSSVTELPPPPDTSECDIDSVDDQSDADSPELEANKADGDHYSEQIESNADEGLQDRSDSEDYIQGKRKRKQNFSDLEIRTLLTEVNRHRDVVLDTVNDRPTVRLKKKSWSLIQRKMQSVCAQAPETERTVGELREKWYDMKRLVLKTGQSGKSRVSVFSHTSQIMAILNGTFQDEEMGNSVSDNKNIIPNWSEDMGQSNQAEQSERDCQPPQSHTTCAVSLTDTERDGQPPQSHTTCAVSLTDTERDGQPPQSHTTCAVSLTDTERDGQMPYTDSDESDSWDCFQDGTNQKRKRKQNFSDIEISTLLTEVNRHRDVVLDTAKDHPTVLLKKKIWSLIQKKMQSVCAQAPETERTVGDLREKWYDMKRLVLKTGQSGKSRVSVFSHTGQIMAILNGTFQDGQIKLRSTSSSSTDIQTDGPDNSNQSNQERRSDRECQPPQRHNSCEVSRTDTEADSLILEMGCEDSDSDESLQARPKQKFEKRKRKQNYSHLEMTTLLTEVNRHRHVLLGTVKYKSDIQKKNKKWSLIQRKMQSVCAQAPYAERTASDLRDKWYDMKLHALKTPKQNGDTSGVSVFPYRSQVVAILNGTFHDEHRGGTDIQTDSPDNSNQSNQERRSDRDCQPPQRHNSCEVSRTDTEADSLILEMDCEDSDSDESLQARPKQKRKRKQNYSDLEISTLLTEVNRHRHVLLGTVKDKRAIQTKNKKWSLIQRKMQSVCAQAPRAERTSADLRDKWGDMKMHALKTPQQNGDTSEVSVFPYRSQVLAILNGTFHDEHSCSTDIQTDSPNNINQSNQEQRSDTDCQPPQRHNSCELSRTDTEAESLTLYMACDDTFDSDSKDFSQDGAKQRRTRKQNYSHLEMTTLLTEVNRHRHVLLGTGKEKIVVRKKNKKWSLIQRKMQSVCAQAPYAERTAADLRDKWYALKLHALKTPQQNRAKSEMSVFPYSYASQVVAILNGTFQDEKIGKSGCTYVTTDGSGDINQWNQQQQSHTQCQPLHRHNSCEGSLTNTEQENVRVEMDCDGSESEESFQARPKQKRKRKQNYVDLEMTTLLTEINRHRDVLLDTGKYQTAIEKKNKTWSLIQRKMQSVCAQAPYAERTAVDLRDKWNIMKQHALKSPQQNEAESGVSVFPYTSQVLAVLNGTFHDQDIVNSGGTDITPNVIVQPNQEPRSDRDCQPPERNNSCEVTLTVRHTEEGNVAVETDGLKRSLLEPERAESRHRHGPQQWQRVIPHKANNIPGSQDQPQTVNDAGEELCDLLDQKDGGLLSGQKVVSARGETVNGVTSDWTEHSLDCVTKWEPEAALPDSLVLDQVMASAGLGGRSEGGRAVKVEADSLEGRETQHRETQHTETQHTETQHTETQYRETQHTETQYRETQHSTASTVLQQQLDLLVKTCGKLRALGVEAGAVVLGDRRMLSCGSERLRHLLFPPRSVSSATENSSSASGEHGAPGGDWTTVALDTVLSTSQQTCVVDNSQHTLTSNDVNHDAVEGREDDSVHTDQWDSPGPDDDDDVSGDERREERVGGTEPLPPLTAEPWSTACSVSPESGKGEDNVRGSLVVLQNKGSSEVTEAALTADTGTDSIKVKDTGTDSVKVKDTGTDSVKVKDRSGRSRKRQSQSWQDQLQETLVHKCADCGKIFESSKKLRKHEKTHSSEKPFACDICNKAFRKPCFLRRHKERHLGLHKVQCEVCGRKLSSASMVPHMRIHTGEKPYKCDFCGRDFSFVSALKLHRRLHTGEKPFMCDICGKSFLSGPKMRCHRNKHTGEKPYVCDVCGNAYRYKETLTHHHRKHTGIQPHTCDICGKSFAKGVNLNIHKRLHSGEKPYSCQECGESFHRSDVLLLHKRNHDAAAV